MVESKESKVLSVLEIEIYLEVLSAYSSFLNGENWQIIRIIEKFNHVYFWKHS